MTRSYRQKRRAERRDQTRQKIVDAAITLHATKGLAATTMADVAALANVGRVTVYRHFPDEAALVGACSGQYFERHPLPDIETWRSVKDAAGRLRHGLAETYAYHERTEAMMSRVYAEARGHPVMAPYHEHWRRAADILVEAWPARGREKKLLQAAFVLALGFETWRMLVRVQGLNRNEAIKLMMRLTCDCQSAAG